MDWSPRQVEALDAVGRWLKDPTAPQIFRLFGYAGTGKTTLAKHLANQEPGLVLFSAFTGKAAWVMRQRGCDGATTLHSLLYNPVQKNKAKLRELEQTLEAAQATTVGAEERDWPGIEELQRQIAEEQAKLRRPAFELNPASPIKEASLLVIDEGSMPDERLAEDALSFGVKVLVLGDPAQLPPVYGKGFFTSQEPDIVLTEIHRQARENPIISMATTVREGGTLAVGRYGTSEVVARGDFDRDAVGLDVQIIVGRNETRHRANAHRRAARGFPPGGPVVGDRVVCLRNNHELGLLNGGIWTVDEALSLGDDFIDLVVADEEQTLGVRAHVAPFVGQPIPFWTAREAEAFDFGYALTCHKAQGSQWPDVLVVDESHCFRQHARNWLYTAITRASEKVVVVR